MAMTPSGLRSHLSLPVAVQSGVAHLQGDLVIPAGSKRLVVFVHGSGSSRHSPRNRFVAGQLNQAGIGTFLFDLLTPDEERFDERTGQLRFDIGFLAERTIDATRELLQIPQLKNLSVGYFGASTGAAAALVAAAQLPDVVQCVVSRGGRPDLAAKFLPEVKAPTLLIVGGNDAQVLKLNQQAMRQMCCEKVLSVVPGASHLFEEPGTLEKVADIAARWFAIHL